jgi:hypothetical protein
VPPVLHPKLSQIRKTIARLLQNARHRTWLKIAIERDAVRIARAARWPSASQIEVTRPVPGHLAHRYRFVDGTLIDAR